MAHATASCVLFHAAVLVVGLLADTLLGGGVGGELPPRPGAAAGLAAYWVALVSIRLWAEVDGRVLVVYELAWSCSATLLFAAFATWLRRPALLCASGLLVAIDQVLWYVDIAGFLLTGKMPVKVCGYLFWPSTPFARRITSLHHVFFEPVVVALCAQGPGLPLGRGFLVSAAQAVVCQAVCRFTMPLEVAHVREKRGFYYMNVNLCYEAFRDVQVRWIRRHDRARPAVYLPWMLWIWNFGNLVLFTVLAALLLPALRWLAGVPVLASCSEVWACHVKSVSPKASLCSTFVMSSHPSCPHLQHRQAPPLARRDAPCLCPAAPPPAPAQRGA
eukprot:CAMPEP_0179072572 /NCGR_PEP_ID=MMETSP0796-20121207/32125_1 /TAXON_ID=73915 /ORGANISM="Pyrodinium bahamense, Strain pbaha01" /LENGTH=330 /DNA_ID=CAMNT_0020769739 /DNA_START=36 /DNA_END=1026 /DNA_ORIENTATION=+